MSKLLEQLSIKGITLLKIKNNFKEKKSNKKEILIGRIKDIIIILSSLVLLYALIIVLILHKLVAINFLMIVFDLLLMVGFIIQYNFFNFPRDPRNDIYLFYVNIALVFLSLIICVQHWEIVKLILQRYLG